MGLHYIGRSDLMSRAELKDRLQEALYIRDKKAVDLVRDLKIPKSAISQYLSGKSQNMDSERLYAICKYLDVSEPWMMGYDVSMERNVAKKNNAIADIVVRLRTDEDFLFLVESMGKLDAEKLKAFKQLVSTLL
jgi:transcriptional regulator with XRE-family HTH domain